MTPDEIFERLVEARSVGLEGKLVFIHREGCVPERCSCQPREAIAVPTREAIEAARCSGKTAS